MREKGKERERGEKREGMSVYVPGLRMRGRDVEREKREGECKESRYEGPLHKKDIHTLVYCCCNLGYGFR